jgi:hypothetical protein
MRFIVTELSSGVSIDRMNAFQVATVKPNDPAFIGPANVAMGGATGTVPTGWPHTRAR